jgi:xanthine dehydrogenase YagR molybdenum-binding subunit
VKREGPDLRIVGRSFARVEGPDKVTGRARYAADMRLPGILYARILRSRLPHARIRRIDAARAMAMPGVRAVISSENAPAIEWYDESSLFDRTVRFVGDEVAAVAADSAALAEDALRLIEVEYEAFPFETNFLAATSGKANIEGRGDIAAGLRAADVVTDATYTTQTALHNAMEPHGCTALWEGGSLVLYESTQGVHDVRDEVARKLGLPAERVRVVTQHMGGGFGAKQIAWKHSVIAALLAQRTARPVQLMLDRAAENLAAGNRNATRQRVRLGARRDGRLTAIDVQIRLESGAYSVGGEDSDVAGAYLTLYRCDNVRTEQTAVRTHLGPAVAFRAPGHAEAAFALESAMDELARELGLDPIELRLRNYTDVDQRKRKPYTSAGSLRSCYESISKFFRGREPGMGFAAHDWSAGGGHPPAEARVELREDGTVHVIAGVQDIGTGTRTALCQIAAEALGVALDKVSISLGDTALGAYGPTSAGSASLASLGPAVRAAAASAQQRSGGRGARGANPSDKSVRTCGAQCAQVEVDTDTGEVRVLRVVAAHDCGRIVNPMLVDSQVWGGITQALGYALMEERVVDERLGVVLNADLEMYHVPTAADLVEMVNATQSMPDEEANLIGAKGIGEPPLIPTAAALANAVFDAVGVRIRDLPLTRDKLIR